MEHDIRPWGEYFVLEDKDTHKVKRIKVKPKGRLSYQYHHKRSEVWTIVSGVGRITLDGQVKDYQPGEVIQISQGMKHRIENPSENEDCVFIEVQLGTYFGEDDIVRIEDDYNRN
ncbi:phosphomannose isomerase type II C-terminal cupin domain [Psychroflexus sediminis]|uniref:Mannose-6-phosphate isomerase, type 2 n=1 Tax=Psychroflexus sediminis TaxID=470826 RepID=A0A1G7UIG2_9FLAO|nr:phosphomannose isomerase type II C-terminal cupin domain [Psychroflexus sediminis]SDG47294.1 mannose-6-phosphate isomerase, type 2 [Psychroflexus sediminis]